MKKLICLTLLLSFTFCGFAQVIRDTAANKAILKSVGTTTIRTIPATKASLVRKDAGKLKLQLAQFQDSVTIAKKDIDAAVDQLKKDLDGLSEMGEMESLRLQMAMDRMSKMMSTLSNLLKKMSETSQSITQNLK